MVKSRNFRVTETVGLRPSTPPPPRGLGDVVETLAKPIARVIDATTARIIPKHKTDLANCPGCQKRKAALNKAVPFHPKA